jgi:putative addiction module component (TIGR02574 family)
MTDITHIDEIRAAVFALPEKVQAQLVDAVLENLLDPGPLSEAWKAELDRREAEYQAGKVELIDNDEAFARVRARLR